MPNPVARPLRVWGRGFAPIELSGRLDLTVLACVRKLVGSRPGLCALDRTRRRLDRARASWYSSLRDLYQSLLAPPPRLPPNLVRCAALARSSGPGRRLLQPLERLGCAPPGPRPPVAALWLAASTWRLLPTAAPRLRHKNLFDNCNLS